MDYFFQNIIIFIVFVIAIWSLINYFRNTLEGGGCSDSCGACSTKSDDFAKIKTKKLL